VIARPDSFSLGLGSTPTVPSGSVASMAANASAVMAMRIMCVS
jgi:hypothetical protein